MQSTSTSDKTVLGKAIELAVENVRSGRGGPFGAIIARGDSIIATGSNLVTATNDPTAHAEVTAIRAAAQALANFDLSGCDLYTSCEPCPMCLGAIYWARITRVFYAATSEQAKAAGFDDSLFYEELAKPAPDRSIHMRHVDHADSQTPFDAWLESLQRTPY